MCMSSHMHCTAWSSPALPPAPACQACTHPCLMLLQEPSHGRDQCDSSRQVDPHVLAGNCGHTRYPYQLHLLYQPPSEEATAASEQATVASQAGSELWALCCGSQITDLSLTASCSRLQCSTNSTPVKWTNFRSYGGRKQEPAKVSGSAA